MSNRHNPEFSDVEADIGGFGCLSGGGAEEHHTAREKMIPEGIQYTMHCDTCGQPNNVVVEWGEFVYGMNKATPPNWALEPALGGFHPKVPCQSCRHLLIMVVTPDECQRQVRRGINANRVNPNDVQQLSQQIQQQTRR